MKYNPDTWKKSGNYFTFKDHNIFYRKEGSGQTIILLHGFPTSSWDWSKIWDQLIDNYELIAPDFLGFGFSDKPPKHDYSLIEQTDIIEELCYYLDIQSAHILAHDYGDTVLQELLDRQIKGNLGFNLNSGFMLNGGIIPEKIQFRFIQRLLLSPIGWIVSKFINKNRFEKSFSSIFAFDKIPTDEELDGFWDIVSTNNGHKLGHRIIRYIDERFENQERWVNSFIDTNIPIHFLVGTEDPVSGKPMGEFFEDLVGEEFVTFMRKVGHYPQWEAPEQVLDNYKIFMESVK